MRKVNAVAELPQNLQANTVKASLKAWDRAITLVDRHSCACRPCNAKRNPHSLAATMGATLDPLLAPQKEMTTRSTAHPDAQNGPSKPSDGVEGVHGASRGMRHASDAIPLNRGVG